MTDRRLKLDSILREICPNVYFNPPESIKLIYPCILYKRSVANTRYADNITYTFMMNYQLTLIDRDPDNDMIDKILKLPLCRFDRHYIADKLSHDVFDIYY